MKSIIYELLLAVVLPLLFVSALLLSAYIRYKRTNYPSTFKNFMKYHCLEEEFLFHIMGIPALILASIMIIKNIYEFLFK